MNGETEPTANTLDYSVVDSYWKKADPSIMGPYMMEGFGFPASAGSFRFRAESVIVQQLIHNAKVDTTGTVLDLGSGVGFWAEFFAQKFKKVFAVEASAPLYESMVQRCSSYDNFTPIHDDVLSFEPESRCSLIFLGGLLMYLNEKDVVALLRKLKPFLTPGGIILCRESTVRNGTVTRNGEYQAVYRSVPTYLSLFNSCGLAVAQTCLNVPYILLQMGCEFIKTWKENVPGNLQMISTVGHLAYWGLRLGNPWITRIPAAVGIDFPELTNHFFLIRSSDKTSSISLGMVPSFGGSYIRRFLYKNLPNIVSLLGVLPLSILFFKDGFQYLIPLIIYNNIVDDLDGILAIKLNLKSDFGAALDNVCDAVAHIIIVMALGIHYGLAFSLVSLVAVTAILLRVTSRLTSAETISAGSPTNELMRHLLLVLLTAQYFEFAPEPFLIAAMLLNSISMLSPFPMPYLIRTLTKSATAIGFVNVALLVAWLIPIAAPVIAFGFFATHLYSLIRPNGHWAWGQ